MTDFNYKSIADPIHGAMGFSQCEVEVINSAVFQRLRNVKHLGFAHYVFPGADFSRFSHSLGVCHLTGRILDALCRNGEEIPDEENPYFRLAGLLHDIGHYPFSHACEVAIK
ncbi:MAG: HD domain-containing protein, partial [Candidatus Hydrogenedentes bacterium]|nr:HD domain-containing protein [Candidatus Hydrogenedentota bacterium]